MNSLPPSSRSGIPISWLRRTAEFTEIHSTEQPVSDQEAILRREAKEALETRHRIEERWKEPRWRVLLVIP